MTGLEQRINEWMNSHSTDFLLDLEKLVEIDSVQSEPLDGKPFGKGCAKVLETALNMAKSCGFEIRNFDNYVGTATFKGTDTSRLDILAHLDVVAAGTGWLSDPFSVTEKDGFLYGRGVIDDKGPALAALYAMRCLSELGEVPSKGCRLILGCAEETGSEDLDYYFATQKSAQYTFTPDSAFPVCCGEKGMYRPNFVKSIGGEDSVERRVVSLKSGNAVNIVPELAECRLCGLTLTEIKEKAKCVSEQTGVTFDIANDGELAEITAHGTSAHASTPQMGKNALAALLKLLCVIGLSDCESTSALCSLSELFPYGETDGETVGVKMSDSQSGDLTLAFSMLTFKNGTIDAHCDLRVPFCGNEKNVKNVLDSRLKALGFTVDGKMIKPHSVDPKSDFVKLLNDSYRLVTGRSGGTYCMGGGTYVHDIENGVAFGAAMDGYDCCEHGAQEKVKLSDLIDASKIFAVAIMKICG